MRDFLPLHYIFMRDFSVVSHTFMRHFLYDRGVMWMGSRRVC